ncbi:MAG: hypothetical protein EOO16_01720 [Chitinophagaceae bacterium]|nr:MAG: hypothetical protein EOO16_01720 [Chitinophagaceae bacterium]
MKKILIAALLLPATVSAQDKAVFAAEATTHLNSEIGPGFGGRISAAFPVASGLSLGASVEGIKFRTIRESLYVPLTFNIVVGPFHSFFATVESGFGLHNTSYTINRNSYGTKGGACFFGGAGYRFPEKSTLSAQLTAGYSSFGFVTKGILSDINGFPYHSIEKHRYGCFAVRLGICLR